MTGPAAGGPAPPREQVVLTRLRGQPGPGFRLVVALLALGLAVAAWKPWGANSPSEGGSPPGVGMVNVRPTASGGATPRIASPSSTPTFDPDRSACEAGVGWRVFALVHDSGFKSRMWIAMEPVPASGPADAAIPTIPLGGERVAVLGYCTDFRSHPKRTVVLAGIWRVDSSVASQLAVNVAAQFSPDDAAMGLVLNPPLTSLRASSSGQPSWQPGRYVFALEIKEGGRTDESWFGIRVIARCPAPGSPVSGSPPPGSPVSGSPASGSRASASPAPTSRPQASPRVATLPPSSGC